MYLATDRPTALEYFSLVFTDFQELHGDRTSGDCVATIAGTLVSGSLAAYAFACLRARGRNLIFALLLSTMMLPAQVTMSAG